MTGKPEDVDKLIEQARELLFPYENGYDQLQDIADALAAQRDRIAELEQHVADMIDDSGQECACGYDNPTDVCLGHKPMFDRMHNRISELETALVTCRQAAIWTPRHPACERVIEVVSAALDNTGTGGG